VGPELYKKYRPQSLNEFYGNENTVASLKSYLKSKDKFPTAVLFHGPSGCGKTTLARILKTELGCSDMDFTELNTANTRGIDTIREIVQYASFTTFSGGVKIYLFDEVHKLTNDAQNALLKILEDTPPRVYFVLCTTEPSKLIKTFLNRCTLFQVNPLSSIMVLALLEKVCRSESKEVSKDVLREISRACEGSPRQALVILDQVIDLEPKLALQVVQEVVIGEAKVIDICRLLAKPKSSGKWNDMVELYRNLEGSEPEQIRVAITNYLTTVLLNNGEERTANIMQFFSDPFINTQKGGLVLALWKACKL